MEVYKIKNEKGKYSDGRIPAKFTTDGKTWKDKNSLRLHLRTELMPYGNQYEGCTIVTFIVNELDEAKPKQWLSENPSTVEFLNVTGGKNEKTKRKKAE